jgi:hypothetical protein
MKEKEVFEKMRNYPTPTLPKRRGGSEATKRKE